MISEVPLPENPYFKIDSNSSEYDHPTTSHSRTISCLPQTKKCNINPPLSSPTATNYLSHSRHGRNNRLSRRPNSTSTETSRVSTASNTQSTKYTQARNPIPFSLPSSYICHNCSFSSFPLQFIFYHPAPPLLPFTQIPSISPHFLHYHLSYLLYFLLPRDRKKNPTILPPRYLPSLAI